MESPEESTTENRIALWPARNRERGDKVPYLTGKVDIGGVEYFVTLWKRDPHSPQEPVLSGQVTPVTKLDI
jgi:hypothetical protein